MTGARLIISDFDGTFTDKTLRVDEGLAEAIRAAKKRDVFFSIVSGRSYDFMVEYCGKLGGLIDSFVVENGCIGHFNGKKYICKAAARTESRFSTVSIGRGCLMGSGKSSSRSAGATKGS